MRQIVQEPGSGELSLQDVPSPQMMPGGVAVRTVASAISAGTERSMIEMGRKSLLGKAKARPDLVRKVLRKGKQEGWLNALQTARSRLERPRPLGYSAAGIVTEVGEDVRDLSVGDRVAVGGAGYANHAEVNVVPRNLAVSVPEAVELSEAAYTTIGAIALQGVRLAQPELADRFVVIGLGLVGLIAMQALRGAGCRVAGVDLDEDRVDLGRRLGLDLGIVLGRDDVSSAVAEFTNGRGADGVVVAAATQSNQPVETAGEVARSKGRVVVVGNVKIDLPRQTYYEKELEVTVSRSYGPGRYDPSYEEGGVDYPVDYVRWTEQRNMEAVLDLIARDAIDVEALTTHRFPFDRALEAYEVIEAEDSSHVGIILEYDRDEPDAGGERIRLRPEAEAVATDVLGVAFVGAGKYATAHLLPHLADRPDVRLLGLLSGSGPNARKQAEKFGFGYCASEYDALLADDDIDAVFIATRHSTHAELAIRGLKVGKHVFVEKPLAVDASGLDDVREAFEAANAERPTGLMVGLNRRFAPLVEELRGAVTSDGIRQMMYRINAGPIPVSSWLHRPDQGGGMLIGEMCHFVDLMMYLSDECPVEVLAVAPSLDREDVGDEDNVSLTVRFDGGSIGTLFYSTLGSKAVSKERLEVYGGGAAAWLDDFRTLTIARGSDSDRSRKWNQDKGRSRQIAEVVEGFRIRGRAPVPPEDLFSGMEAIFAARRSLQTRAPVRIPAPR